MKIVNFTPGLGNQIFEWIFSEYLRKRFPKENIFGYYNPKFLKKHNGLEIHKVFDIELPPEQYHSNIIVLFCRIFARVFPSIKSTDARYLDKALYYDGWWQDKKFFLDSIQKLKFRERTFDKICKEQLDSIKKTKSVSIHIRRGDYLEPQNIKNYGGICTQEYYEKAIDIIKEKIKNPTFFIFSNDMEWVRNNLNVDNAVFVDGNTGKNSYIDMFLMSNCKANIIANSSFSYWGAMLNPNDNIVIYPGKWFNSHTPDLFPGNWIAL